jgi:RNA polymerase sigma factor (sigma-70 family)
LLGDVAGLNDAHLLARFIEHRDELAFEALVRRHGPMVLGVCRRLLRGAHDAEDAFQATFLVLARKAGALKSREAVGNWLYGVAYNVAQKARSVASQRRARERQVAEMPEPEAVRQNKVSDDLLPVLVLELSRLPEKYRVPVVLCDLEGRPRREVAGQLRIPEGTLSSRLTTARRMLAKRLTRHGMALPAGALAAVLSEKAAACMPASLVASTVKAAGASAAVPVASGLISAKVVALTEGVLKSMFLTKLKVATLTVLAIGLAFGGATVSIRAGRAEAEPVQQVAKPAAPQDRPERDEGAAPKGKTGQFQLELNRVRALQKERLALLRHMAKVTALNHKQGTVSQGDVLKANLRVYRAELDLCETDKERVSAHEKIVDALKMIEERVVQAHKAAAESEAAVAEAKLARLEAEIALEQARAKAAEPAK